MSQGKFFLMGNLRLTVKCIFHRH